MAEAVEDEQEQTRMDNREDTTSDFDDWMWDANDLISQVKVNYYITITIILFKLDNFCV